MRKLLKKGKVALTRQVRSPGTSNLGFHGDQYLLNIIDPVLHESDTFVETGTRVGTTLRYVHDRYPHLQLHSCEPNPDFFEQAEERLGESDRAHLHQETSQDFLPDVFSTTEGTPFFFLDAHGDGFEWPLRFEIERITREEDEAYILIDDFKVPSQPQFGYDKYDGQVCSMEYISDCFDLSSRYASLYPNYDVRTSKHHPLRGYVLIAMNTDFSPIPSQLLENYNFTDSL